MWFFQRVFAALTLVIALAGISGCESESSRGITNGVPNTDPEHGYILNSTNYALVIDINGRNEYQVRIQSGEFFAMTLEQERTHLLHVIVLDDSGQALAEYVNSFYINESALDNHVRNFVCSWYVDVTSTSGYANTFGS
ncbi:hypothetical protein CSB45_11495 [candidate division KSB3 bacterium]|uniref:Uncharacterized protein n=1 Tax=candidate division KSB3 bacterium TaxID=2044937 RepID=A0A2G6E3W1_9BACT|nr:MAG: hypothetical protein CSB45_11495 [candidate division KSB3 bacterium]PIE28935.1 MAG: hypothetical protein CSA57_11540 [candidate division KSB3 bacterium]